MSPVSTHQACGNVSPAIEDAASTISQSIQSVVSTAPTPRNVSPAIEDAASTIAQGIQDAATAWKQWQEARGGSIPIRTKKGTFRRAKRTKVSAPPPRLIMAGVGTGKTSIATVTAVETGIPLLILVANNQLKDEMIRALRSKYPALNIYDHRGRRPAMEMEAPTAPGVCQMMTLVDDLGAKEQTIMPVACTSGCPAGIAASCITAASDNARSEAYNRLTIRCESRGIEPEKVAPCGYLLGLSKAKDAQVIVACYDSFSPPLAEASLNGKLVDRLILIDEEVAAHREITVTLGDIRMWRENLQSLIDESSHEDAERLQEINRDMETCIVELASANMTDVEVPVKIRETWQNMCRKAEAWVSGEKTLPTAEWERAWIDWTDTNASIIPLRAIMDMGAALATDTAEIDHGTLIGSIPSPITQAELAREIQVIHLDATPSPDTLALVEGLGGTIIKAIPDQPMQIEWGIERAWSRGKRKLRAKKAIHKAKVLARLDAKRPGAAIFADKATIETYAELKGMTAEKMAEKGLVGWYGAHDRGNNNYSGRNLIVMGGTAIPPAVERRQWRAYRALAKAMGRDLPEWTDGRSSCEIEVTPGKRITSPKKWSADPDIRRWQQTRAANDLAQVLGRSRSLHHPDTSALILGTPLWLGDHGYHHIKILEHDPIECGVARKDRNHASHVDARARICKAGMELVKRGIMPSRRKVGAILRGWKLPVPGEHTWQAWLDEVGEEWGEKAMSMEFWHEVAGALITEGAELDSRGVKTVVHNLLVRARNEKSLPHLVAAEILTRLISPEHRLERALAPPAA